MPQATLWFAHGWAYDASFWAPRAALSDWPQVADDAGYFGAPACRKSPAR